MGFGSSHHTVLAPRSEWQMRELMLIALEQSLDFLQGEGSGPGQGGFESTDMSQWLWGMRHQVRFESLLGEFLDQGSPLALLVDLFSITTEQLPLASDMAADDPRRSLKWFPRGGDNYAVDAANPGFSGTSFSYGSGPVMRMAFSLEGGKVEGVNIIPGGQSGLNDSDYYADQAALWLGNETLPMRFHVSDVVAGATGRELYQAPE